MCWVVGPLVANKSKAWLFIYLLCVGVQSTYNRVGLHLARLLTNADKSPFVSHKGKNQPLFRKKAKFKVFPRIILAYCATTFISSVLSNK